MHQMIGVLTVSVVIIHHTRTVKAIEYRSPPPLRYRKSDSRQIAVGESGQGKASISKGRMFRQNLPLTQNNFYQSEDISNKAVKGHFKEKSKTPLWDAAGHGFSLQIILP